MSKPILIGFLPPLGGLPKTPDFFDYHQALINTGDIAYTSATTLLTAGPNHMAWNSSASAAVVNEAFSQVIWAIPCRIAAPPIYPDGYPYEAATRFIEQLTIPFTALTESVQSNTYEYDPDLHRRLTPEVVRYLKVIAEKSKIVGTRGEYSAGVLNRLGIHNVEPIGCPSLFWNGPALNPSLLRKKPFSEVKRIAVAYSNYQMNPGSRIGKMLELATARDYYFVEQTSNIVPKLLYYPGRIEAADLLKASQLYGGLRHLRRLFNRNRVRYFTNYHNWKSFVGGMDFVFGARMHGLTPAVHSGVPAYFIAHDSRVREMCEYFHLPFSPEKDFADTDFDAEALYDKTDYQAAIKDYSRLYFKFMIFLSHNQILANTDWNLAPIQNLDYRPAPGVEIELDPRSDDPINLHHTNELFDLGESIAKQGSADGYEPQVSACCQRWLAELAANPQPCPEAAVPEQPSAQPDDSPVLAAG
jgi:hypothetical protein